MSSLHPTISYRPIRPADLDILQRIHGAIFPIRYEAEFFQNIVYGRGIVSWAAVDQGRDDGKDDELIGFVTARVVQARESEIADLLDYESPDTDQSVVYILTLGVVQAYRNLGIATSLILEVIKYGSSIRGCQAVYLHVISYNDAAIRLYQKMSFNCIRTLPAFYLIDGQHYDSHLFVYFVNSGRSLCSPSRPIAELVRYVRSYLRSMKRTLWKSDDKTVRWPKTQRR